MRPALNHCPYLSKSVDIAEAQMTGSKGSLSGITRRKGVLRTEATIGVKLSDLS